MITATVSTSDPNRIYIVLGSLTGPLNSPTLGAFLPSRDCEVYIGGLSVSVNAYSFDSTNNQYALYTSRAFDPTQLVQVIHHVPSSPFAGANGYLPGFALTAEIVPTVATLLPLIGLSIATGLDLTTPVAFLWTATAVSYFRITATDGYNSGLLSARGGAGTVSMLIEGMVPGTYTATIYAYGEFGNPIDATGGDATTSGLPQVTTSATFTLVAPS
jgi:hypothetical protein